MTEKEKLQGAITEFLAKSQFRYWIDSDPETAAQAKSQDDRAVQHYMDSLLAPQNSICPAYRFRAIVDEQASLIMEIIHKET